ncbi:MAG: glycosyltransferase family 2 protein, partial [Anaerolineae bacterium]|nr:glycosyltransferase family 2 protein [Anaerolineae bacterium]
LGSLQALDDNIIYGIPCPNCDSASYYWFSSRIKTKNITFSELFSCIHYTKFTKIFEKIDKDVVIIANHKYNGHPIVNLNILKYYFVDEESSNVGSQKINELLTLIKKEFGQSRDILYIISVGNLSVLIITELYKNNPNNCYLDLGPSIERLFTKNQSRTLGGHFSRTSINNYWMYDPRKIRFDTTVVLTLYRRPERLEEQLNAIEAQTLRPKEILLFQDAAKSPIELDEKLKSRFDNIIRVEKNVGVWGRFSGGLLAKSKYVCFFDDDTIPGKRWLENCHTQMQKRKGLYGTIGIDSWNLRNYPYKSYKRWGWENGCESTKEVDFVGHSWFLEKDWLGAIWINSSRFYAFKNVAEDAFLSYSLKKLLKIKTFVPPHPKNCLDLFGSIPEKARLYGEVAGVAISQNSVNFEKMNQALKALASLGMGTKLFRLSNIMSKEFVKEKFFPQGSQRWSLAKKIWLLIKK